jgi:hypothetical protein
MKTPQSPASGVFSFYTSPEFLLTGISKKNPPKDVLLLDSK